MATADLGCVPGKLMDWAAKVIGIDPRIVRAQINEESGGNCGAVSYTGAQGPAQFEPGTWQSQGCGGSPFVANDAMKCYAKFMYSLVKQYHGNIRNALAAYNAGPGNLAAGYGYADTILAAAGQPQTATASGGTGDAGSGGAGAPAGAECAWSLGGQHVGILFGHGPTLPSTCVIRKTEIRAFLAALLMVAGVGIVLPGLTILAVYGFGKTKTGATVIALATKVPVGGKGAGRAAGAARSRAPAAPETAPRAAPRAAAPRAAAPVAPGPPVGRRPGDPFRYATPRED